MMQHVSIYVLTDTGVELKMMAFAQQGVERKQDTLTHTLLPRIFFIKRSQLFMQLHFEND